MAGFLVALILAVVVLGVVLLFRGRVKTGAAILVVVAVWLVGSTLLLNNGVSVTHHTSQAQVVQRH